MWTWLPKLGQIPLVLAVQHVQELCCGWQEHIRTAVPASAHQAKMGGPCATVLPEMYMLCPYTTVIAHLVAKGMLLPVCQMPCGCCHQLQPQLRRKNQVG